MRFFHCPVRDVVSSSSLVSTAHPRRFGLLAAMAAAALLCLAPSGARAQTAHFSYVQSIIGSGLSDPSGVAVDSAGNVYIADTNHSQVLKETLSGGTYTQSVVASGLSGTAGGPAGVAVDSAGNVYIANAGSRNVLKETLSGGTYTRSTIVSNFVYPSGVAVDSAGNVYIADSYYGLVKETLSGGTYTQSMIGSGLESPFAVAVDSVGNVYVADTYNSRVVKETPSNGTYTQSTIASGLSGDPNGVAVDGSGNVYVSDTYNNQVLKETFSGGTYTQSTIIASGLYDPFGVAVDSAGNVYVADTFHSRVLKLQTAGVNFDSVPVGSTSAAQTLTFTIDTPGRLGAPVALTLGAPNLDFAVASGGTCAGGAFSVGQTCTVNVTFSPKYAGTRNGAVELTDSIGTVIATAYVYGTGTAPQAVFNSPVTPSPLGSGFNLPQGVAVDGSGNVYVADLGNAAVKEIPAGCTSSDCVTTLGGEFGNGADVAVDGSGNVYVADSVVVEKVPPGCKTHLCVTALGGGFNNPQGVAVDGSGNVYVADTYDSAVKEIPAGCTLTDYRNGACTPITLGGGFGGPTGVAVDGSGNVYVADSGNNAVKEIPAGCIAGANDYTCVITLGGVYNEPWAVEVDGSGTVYVADSSNNEVKEIPAGCTASNYTNGICTTTTLGGVFNYPLGVAVDGSGNVYVGDSNNNAVDKIDRTTPPNLSFEATNVGSQSGPQTVTLQNVGNQDLTFEQPTTGQNPSVAANFSYDASSTCPQLDTSSAAATLGPGATCTLALDFAPTAAGSITGSATITDNNLNATTPSYATQSIGLSGTGLQITLSPTTLPAGTYGLSYSQTITVSGGTGSYSYAVTSGALPSGLNLTTGGVLSGTPVVAGSFNFTITATDEAGHTGSQAYTLVINFNAQTAINYLTAQVQGLSGSLKSGQENSLLKEIQQANSMLNKGKISGAISNLESVISEVKDLQSSGVLTSAQAQPLIAGVQFIINQL